MKFAAISLATVCLAMAAAQAQDAPDNRQEPSGPVLTLPAPEDTNAILDTAQTYAAYHADVDAAGRRELDSGAALDATMDELSRYYDGDRLVNAQIAYAALVAAQHPEFIDSVRAIADYYGTQTAMSALTHDPVYVTGFMGADLASQSVAGAIEEDVDQIRAVGTRYRQAAYDLQRERWAQRRSRDREARLSALESASERLDVNFVLATPEPETGPVRLGSAASLFVQEDAETLAQPDLVLEVGEAQLQPDERRVGRMLALAALQAIEDGDMSMMDVLLDDPSVERCIAWVRLDLAQCIAAGHFKYEDSFCIAEHALNDVAECLTASRAPVTSVSN